MHPVRRPALVHPAFEISAVCSAASLHLAADRSALLSDGSRPDARYRV